MSRKLPVWLEDQDMMRYQVGVDDRGQPFIFLRDDDRTMLSMKDVIDKPPGYEVIWGNFTLMVTSNILYTGIGDS